MLLSMLFSIRREIRGQALGSGYGLTLMVGYSVQYGCCCHTSLGDRRWIASLACARHSISVLLPYRSLPRWFACLLLFTANTTLLTHSHSLSLASLFDHYSRSVVLVRFGFRTVEARSLIIGSHLPRRSTVPLPCVTPTHWYHQEDGGSSISPSRRTRPPTPTFDELTHFQVTLTS